MAAHFGSDTMLASINSDTIGHWRDARLATVSGSTVLREANLLRHLFTVATEEWRWLASNPCRGVRWPRANQARHALWRWQDVRRVLRAGQHSGGKIGEVAAALHIALRTGMRLAEVLRGCSTSLVRVADSMDKPNELLAMLNDVFDVITRDKVADKIEQLGLGLVTCATELRGPVIDQRPAHR